MSELGNEIYKERKSRRIQQVILAKAMGLHQGTLIDIERERLPVGQATYLKALDAMNEIQKKQEAAA